MSSLSDLAEGMLAKFEARNRAREEAFALSRACIRSCSMAIRSVHRGEMSQAQRHADDAKSTLKTIREVLKDQPELRYAGFVDDAEQEVTEALNVLSIIRDHTVLTPDEVGVELVSYLSGMGDVTGELRRHILDLIRQRKPEEGEYFLDTMEEIFYLLMLFDYPEAITKGLRRKSDLARSMLERTRGDLTNAVEMHNAALSIRGLEDKLKDASSKV
jgi:translin